MVDFLFSHVVSFVYFFFSMLLFLLPLAPHWFLYCCNSLSFHLTWLINASTFNVTWMMVQYFLWIEFWDKSQAFASTHMYMFVDVACFSSYRGNAWIPSSFISKWIWLWSLQAMCFLIKLNWSFAVYFCVCTLKIISDFAYMCSFLWCPNRLMVFKWEIFPSDHLVALECYDLTPCHRNC